MLAEDVEGVGAYFALRLTRAIVHAPKAVTPVSQLAQTETVWLLR